MSTKKTSKPKAVVQKSNVVKKQEKRVFSAQEKCEAVLSLWAERRKPSEVSKELGVTWTQINQWQDKALSAMMEVLRPPTRQDPQRGPALGPKLEKMLKKVSQRTQKLSKLEQRLEKIQESQKSA